MHWISKRINLLKRRLTNGDYSRNDPRTRKSTVDFSLPLHLILLKLALTHRLTHKLTPQ